MASIDRSIVLVASCPDKPGIVRAISNFIFQAGASIQHLDQFSEQDTNRFFTRCEFQSFTDNPTNLGQLKKDFASVASEFSMQWKMHDVSVRPRVVIAVSKQGHCLRDLLHRWDDGELSADIVGVISNHETQRSKVELYGIPYFYLPIDKFNKAEQEAEFLGLLAKLNVDLLVLARYMQILSPTMCQELTGKAINIHHSFLPSFKGARPYHQAYRRGVKIIGATAHYVTTDLDEGPIIEQDVQRIAHTLSTQELVRLGGDIESRVLARAVKWHCQHRVLLSEGKTIVFG